MQLLVLGAGRQGSACAYDLLQQPTVDRVTIADVKIVSLPAFLQPFLGDRLRTWQLDAHDGDAVREVMRDEAAVMNALPYYFNLAMTEAAIDAGTHICDLGGNTEIVFQQHELHDRAHQAKVAVLPDCGLAPGMVNILAAEGIRRFERVESVKIYVGGLPQSPEPPLNYQIVYSLEGALDYYTTPSWILRDGEPTQIDALSEVEEITFPRPVGKLEAFHTGGGISTMPWSYSEKVRTMEYKTLRYPGHVAIMRPIRELGLLSDRPVMLNGQAVTPRDVFIATVSPKLRKPEGRDLVALRVEVRGTGGPTGGLVAWEMLDFFDEERGISAMERTTGYSLSLTGRVLAEGTHVPAGVRTPAEAMPFDVYIGGLADRGVAIRQTS